MLSLGLPILLITIMLVMSTLVKIISNFFLKKKLFKFKKLKEKQRNYSDIRRDVYRKVNHIMIFVFLIIVWIIGFVVMGTSDYMILEEDSMLLLYLRIMSEPESIIDVFNSLGWLYYLFFFFFYVLSLLVLINEFTRKSRFFSFPFNILPNLYLSNEEKQNYGTYLYFIISQMFASFISPPMIFFAILGVGSISDLIASQIGIRYGKKHILWNKKKTWEGLIAGSIGTFLICFIFIGILWSLIFTLIFLLIDVFTNKPVNISDNLLIPICCGLAYIFIKFIFKIDYSSIMLMFI